MISVRHFHNSRTVGRVFLFYLYSPRTKLVFKFEIAPVLIQSPRLISFIRRGEMSKQPFDPHIGK